LSTIFVPRLITYWSRVPTLLEQQLSHRNWTDIAQSVDPRESTLFPIMV
jgi:hypothetical protein